MSRDQFLFGEVDISPTPANRRAAVALHLTGYAVTEEDLGYLRSQNLSLHEFARSRLKPQALDKANATIEQHQAYGAHTITYCDQSYPKLLREISKAPYCLFALGDLAVLDNPKRFAIVGTRNPSYFGVKYTESISNYFVKRERSIVSGMARGIDTAAHRAALKANGSTIGVIAHGFDYTYPRTNYDLFEQAHSSKPGQLLLLGEYPLGTRPLRHHFPRRNRIISGLCSAMLMAEGGSKSGALITVNYALAQGREVFALDHEFLMNNGGGRKIVDEGANDFADIVSGTVYRVYSSKGLYSRLSDPNHHYLGDGYWARFEST